MTESVIRTEKIWLRGVRSEMINSYNYNTHWFVFFPQYFPHLAELHSKDPHLLLVNRFYYYSTSGKGGTGARIAGEKKNIVVCHFCCPRLSPFILSVDGIAHFHANNECQIDERKQWKRKRGRKKRKTHIEKEEMYRLWYYDCHRRVKWNIWFGESDNDESYERNCNLHATPNIILHTFECECECVVSRQMGWEWRIRAAALRARKIGKNRK